MAYILIILGVAGLYLDYLGMGNLLAAASLLRAEMFTYSPPFYKWLGAFVIIGALGYVPALRPIATSMLILVILAVLLTKDRNSAVDLTNLLTDTKSKTGVY